MTPNAVGGEPLEEVHAPANGGGPTAAEAWQRDRQGREYVRARGRRGILYRQGDESVTDALARDALARDAPPGDRRPRARSSAKKRTPPKPPAPTKVELKELEKMIAEALRSPAMICATFGDEWAAEHFTKTGPYVARNLVNAAEHNPWLRKKLETWVVGGELPMQLVAMLSVGGALALYIVPPVVWWLNLPVPDRARAMLDIPPRRESEAFADPANGPNEATSAQAATFPAAA